MIPAIQTKYNNYHFRSRTEARWGVFFDALKYPWIYEYEGYNLPSGYYLPDFYFPGNETFLEIKGLPFTEAEKQKCKELSMLKIDGRSVKVAMLDGVPAKIIYPGYCNGELVECYFWGDNLKTKYAIKAALSYRF